MTDIVIKAPTSFPLHSLKNADNGDNETHIREETK